MPTLGTPGNGSGPVEGQRPSAGGGPGGGSVPSPVVIPNLGGGPGGGGGPAPRSLYGGESLGGAGAALGYGGTDSLAGYFGVGYSETGGGTTGGSSGSDGGGYMPNYTPTGGEQDGGQTLSPTLNRNAAAEGSTDQPAASGSGGANSGSGSPAAPSQPASNPQGPVSGQQPAQGAHAPSPTPPSGSPPGASTPSGEDAQPGQYPSGYEYNWRMGSRGGPTPVIASNLSPRDQALADISANRSNYKKLASDSFFKMLKSHPPTGKNLPSSFTDADLRAIADALADEYINAVVQFLKDHWGAEPWKGIRWRDAVKTHVSDDDRRAAPVCEDVMQAMQNYLGNVFDGGLTHTVQLPSGQEIRLKDVVELKYGQSWAPLQPNFPAQKVGQHNFMVLYPKGYSPPEHPGLESDSVIRILDPWPNIRPGVYTTTSYIFLTLPWGIFNRVNAIGANNDEVRDVTNKEGSRRWGVWQDFWSRFHPNMH